MSFRPRIAVIALAAALAPAFVTAVLVATAPPVTAFPTNPGMPVGPPQTPNLPPTAEQCRDGGWQTYTDAKGNDFPNWGYCVSYADSQGHSDGGGGPQPDFRGNPG